MRLIFPDPVRQSLSRSPAASQNCFLLFSVLRYFIASLLPSVRQLPSPSRVPPVPLPAPALLLQTPRDAYQCPLPRAAPKSSTARPTSRAAPARRGSPCRTSSAATNPHQSWSSRDSCEFPADKASTLRSLRHLLRTL